MERLQVWCLHSLYFYAKNARFQGIWSLVTSFYHEQVHQACYIIINQHLGTHNPNSVTGRISLNSFYYHEKKKIVFFRPNFWPWLGHCDMLIMDIAAEMTMLKQDIVIQYILEYKVDTISIDWIINFFDVTFQPSFFR